jgi:hypothetical protein
MDHFLGHRAKITPPVLINRGTDFDLDDDASASRSEVMDDQGMTPRTAGQEGEDDPYLTGVHHRAAKKKRKSFAPDQGEALKEVVGTLETRWEKEDKRDDARTASAHEDNNRFYGLLSRVVDTLERLADKDV